MKEGFQAALIQEHKEWLRPFPEHLKLFQDLLQDQEESALCEAAVRRFLEKQECIVEPHPEANTNDKTPDFVCRARIGDIFYAEATLAESSSLDESLGFSVKCREGEARGIGLLDKMIFRKLRAKEDQLSDLEHPCILAIGVFHPETSVACLDDVTFPMYTLGQIAWSPSISSKHSSKANVDVILTGRNAPFFGPGQTEHCWEFKRRSISAWLVCGFGTHPWNIYGALHPSPARHFNPAWLSDTRFCELSVDLTRHSYEAKWIGK